MSRVGHTPGPWCINPNHPQIISTEDNDADIAEVDGWPLDLAAEEQANRYLIAAAPCLLEALENFDSWFGGFDPNNQASRMEGRKVVIRARAAIHRARTGEVS